MHQHARTRHGPSARRGDNQSDPRLLREELRRTHRHGAGHRQFGFGDLFGSGRRGPVVRRGEVRSQILSVLRDRPMHGYEVIQELEAQSDGRWRPSAGSIYPTLQQLADEGLVTGGDVDGRRVYTITDEGRTVAAESADRSPWTETGNDDRPDIRKLVMQLVPAAIQVDKVGSPHAKTEATRILSDARKQMYRLLSEDDDASADDAGES